MTDAQVATRVTAYWDDKDPQNMGWYAEAFDDAGDVRAYLAECYPGAAIEVTP
jgi:hypothetical protein